MSSSFSSALAALKAHSTAIETVGHNLANVNTNGFKAVDVAFKDLVVENLRGGNGIGMGVVQPITVRNFNQGSVQASNGPLHAAIQGNGFFVVRDTAGNKFYTRDGSFQVDESGAVTTLTGERVLSSSLKDILVPNRPSPPTSTANMTVFANLNSNAAVGEVFNSAVEVVDSKGDRHVITLAFTKTGPDAWEMQASIPGDESGASGATAGTPFDLLTTPIDIQFDGTGKMTAPAVAGGSIDISAVLKNADDLDLKLNLYDTTGAATLAQVAAASTTIKTSQDGLRSGQLLGVSMADEGRVVAKYDSGAEIELGQLAIAKVSDTRSLSDIGNNLFRASGEEPDLGVAGQGGRGQIKGGALEGSTVDIAREFTNLIVYQRGYQANSRVITTADELSQEVLNLKR
jgi:flagellar hook protein FlgE